MLINHGRYIIAHSRMLYWGISFAGLLIFFGNGLVVVKFLLLH